MSIPDGYLETDVMCAPKVPRYYTRGTNGKEQSTHKNVRAVQPGRHVKHRTEGPVWNTEPTYLIFGSLAGDKYHTE